MLTARRTTPGTCRTVMSLYLAALDHTKPVDQATALQAARHTELQLASLDREVAAVYIADAASTLRTDPDLHRARLAWARGLANHTVRP
ncbi:MULTISPECIES: hypothetical protein [Streptomyces]|uniref:Uncharacterized protein n=1 Tax=Streptomyces muensis TaxID=1077944 RepID=A0A9X1PRZ6_STRM4|nr:MULTISPECIES: hypothetical protein [Streptomyces]MCF1592432.1 hypothetical protein [Streptomyces muensis]QKV98181.1 hypothetical protein HUT19_41405 [Streptomyces sp. NA02950]